MFGNSSLLYLALGSSKVSVDICKYLLSKGGKLIIDNFPEAKNITAIKYAVKSGMLDKVKYVFEEFDVNPEDVNSSLILASIESFCPSLEVVKYLIEEKNVDYKYIKRNGSGLDKKTEGQTITSYLRELREADAAKQLELQKLGEANMIAETELAESSNENAIKTAVDLQGEICIDNFSESHP